MFDAAKHNYFILIISIFANYFLFKDNILLVLVLVFYF